MPVYKNIPVDEETHEMVIVLCEAHELPKRSKGAMVRRLVKAEYLRLKALKLLPKKEGEKANKDLPKAE